MNMIGIGISKKNIVSHILKYWMAKHDEYDAEYWMQAKFQELAGLHFGNYVRMNIGKIWNTYG